MSGGAIPAGESSPAPRRPSTRDLGARLFSRVIKPPYVWLRRTLTTALFDRRHGVHTEERVALDSLGVTSTDRCDYMPYGWLSLRRILPHREVTDHDVFVDVGSGMGRVVLQAAMSYRFRRVIGVELAPALHEIAMSNVERNRARLACSEVSLVLADALTFDIPHDVTVVFLHNPFGGEVFNEFLRRLLRSVDSHPRQVRIVYGNPVEEAALLATGRVRHTRSLRGWRPTRAWSLSNSTRMYVVEPAPVRP